MEERWAGSCKVNGLPSLCVNGKQRVVRAEDQAMWEEILVQSHSGGESQSHKRQEVISESMCWEQHEVREESDGSRGITACCSPGDLFSEGLVSWCCGCCRRGKPPVSALAQSSGSSVW